MTKLWVWFSPHLIGTIENTSEGITFTYSESWLHYQNNFQLSNSLSFVTNNFKMEARNFFGNLLPEGNTRDALCKRFGISMDNDFELLARIGQDCAGAFTITNSSQPPNEKAGLEEIPVEELAAWLKEDSVGLLDLQVEGDLRLSLAGAQNKLPLVYKDAKFYKPIGSHATTHILKPAPRGFKNIPQNEWINARLYSEFGLITAPSELVKIGSRYALLVERYDRMLENGKWLRLHQEDFCQALAISYKRKYEQEKGPSLLNCQELIDMRSHDPAADIDALIKWQILNVLVGNCDGHGKNLSLLRSKEGHWRLAPFYDLVATTIYPRLTKSLAMSVNEQFQSGTIHPKHWQKQFKLLKISPAFYLKKVKEMIKDMPVKLDTVLSMFEKKYGKSPFLAEYKAHQMKIVRRNAQLINSDDK